MLITFSSSMLSLVNSLVRSSYLNIWLASNDDLAKKSACKFSLMGICSISHCPLPALGSLRAVLPFAHI